MPGAIEVLFVNEIESLCIFENEAVRNLAGAHNGTVKIASFRINAKN
jgi:hypothetical protein